MEEIPPSAKWFTVLDLKCAFFCIPLAKESQYLFAFEWEAPGEKHQQTTWTVLPQGFRDSPHLFGQALSRDLLDLDLGPNGKVLQYVNDLLICSPDEKSAQQHAIQVLNFLAERVAAFSSFSSLPGLKPSQTNETQALMSHCKNSLRDKAIRGRFVRIQGEATLQGVNCC